MFPLDALLGIGNKLIDHFFPDANQAAEAKLKLLEMQQNGELAQLNADVEEQKEVSSRWTADMSSDSWLAKNIRPMSLIAIFTGYFLFAMMSAFGYEANESYVTLLGNWGMLVFGAYFGSRTLEKVTEIRSRNAK